VRRIASHKKEDTLPNVTISRISGADIRPQDFGAAEMPGVDFTITIAATRRRRNRTCSVSLSWSRLFWSPRGAPSPLLPPWLAGKEILEYLLAGNRAAVYNRGIYTLCVCVCMCVRVSREWRMIKTAEEERFVAISRCALCYERNPELALSSRAINLEWILPRLKC